MGRRSFAVGSLFVCLLAPVAGAQLQLTLTGSFVDNQAGGNGNIGVTQDEVVGNIYVLDFSNTQTVHEFDGSGNFLNQFSATSCAPSSPTPNDVTWDAALDTLWIVDNDNSGTVTQISRTGVCLGGFSGLNSLGTNPVGITYERNSQTLFVSMTGQVLQFDRNGTQLGGGFAFTPPAGSSILAGITYVPATGNFLIVSSAGSALYEVSPTGALVSTTSLSPFGIINTQGLHYNPTTGTLLVVDNSLSTTFLFDLGCPMAVPYGSGCAGSGGFVPQLELLGCTKPGNPVTLQITQGLGNSIAVIFVAAAPALIPLGGGCSFNVQPPAFTIFLPLGGIGPGNGSISAPTQIPPGSPSVTIALQAFVSDPAAPILLAASNGVSVPIQ